MKIGIAVFLGFLIAISCKQKINDPVEIAKEVNETNLDRVSDEDSKYVVDAYSNNLYEIRISEGAETLSTNVEVQKLGAKLADAHTVLNERIEEMAKRKSITLPPGLSEDQIKNADVIKEKVGYDFNLAYAQEIYDNHKTAVDEYKKVIEKAADPEIKEWAESTLPEIENHLSIASECYNNIKIKNK
jgi:putative membrane protein